MCAGYRNVIAAYGVNGFTQDHWAALKRHGTRAVWIAYDRDDAGATRRRKRSALNCAKRAWRHGACCCQGDGRQRIREEGDGWRAKSLGAAAQAEWIGKAAAASDCGSC
ncbi:toprim domain-containing protein [Paraburkholderia sp. A1RI-2L]|uniref:toprim domain-containing protein n=1 Tax=Paraburkholderia sp. A1RI-2L TaxID=3028367 RepID=UPI003BA1BACF